MYRSIWAFLLSFGFALLINNRAIPIETHSTPDFPHEREVIDIKGKVVFVQLEGGFWGIVSEDGQRYDPHSLAPMFQKKGILVRVKARISDRVVQIHMWGRPIEILKIQEINGDQGRPAP